MIAVFLAQIMVVLGSVVNCIQDVQASRLGQADLACGTDQNWRVLGSTNLQRSLGRDGLDRR